MINNMSEWIYKTGDIITKAVYEYGDKTKTWESHYSSTKTLQFRGSYYMGKPKRKTCVLL